MDTFSTFDLAELCDLPVETRPSPSSNDSDVMRELVDEDQRLHGSYYGGACTIT
uniref:Pheromone Phb3.1 B45 n=1 Tax=Coprinopsis cinerea TaxID=5346 RepID=Q6TMB3_COPCI|nr:pheromone precursor Phb3.1 B45 [Coprinopsis cinerea]